MEVIIEQMEDIIIILYCPLAFISWLTFTVTCVIITTQQLLSITAFITVMSACQNSSTTIADDVGVKGTVQLRTIVLSHHPLECVQNSDNVFTHRLVAHTVLEFIYCLLNSISIFLKDLLPAPSEP